MARILVVDDVEENVYLLQLTLAQLGHEIVPAYNGPDALEIARKEDVDLVLLDVMMPRMSGLEVASLLKENERTKHVPIIFLTAQKKNAEDIAEGLEAGADEYITKPFHHAELVARVNSMLRVKTLYDQVSEAKRTIEEELRTAKVVQSSLLPTRFPYPDRIRFSACYKATSSIGGDYYDVFDYGSGKIGMMIADVSGHGPSAALIVSMIKSLLNAHHAPSASPEKIVRNLNDQLIRIIPDERYVTLFFGTMDLQNETLTYVRAGHPFPFLLREEDGSIENLTAGGEFVGLFNDFDIEQETVGISRGDRLLMYSDGLIEVIDEDNNLFGVSRLRRSLEARFDERGDDLLEGLLADANSFNADAAPSDDVAILLAELL